MLLLKIIWLYSELILAGPISPISERCERICSRFFFSIFILKRCGVGETSEIGRSHAFYPFFFSLFSSPTLRILQVWKEKTKTKDLHSLYSSNNCIVQGRQVEFDPGKTQYSSPIFFTSCFLYVRACQPWRPWYWAWQK